MIIVHIIQNKSRKWTFLMLHIYFDSNNKQAKITDFLCCLFKDHVSSKYFSRSHLSLRSLFQKLDHSTTCLGNVRPTLILIFISTGRIYNLHMNLMMARSVLISFYYGPRVKNSCRPLCYCPSCLK